MPRERHHARAADRDSKPPLRFPARPLVALAALLSIVPTGGRARGQALDGASFPIMGLSRASAFVDAARRNLDYLPGEVLVQFKPGASTRGRQRALMALRSRPAVSNLQWITADTALHADSQEWDATILAAQLREQPEVARAEPNYLRHTDFTPGAPGFAAHQWNLTAIDMPRAWDISAGGSSSLIVAVVDTGITTVNASLNAVTWNGTAIQPVNVAFRISPDLPGTRLVAAADLVTPDLYSGVVVDTEGHGTHVASTIGETANGLAETGIAFNVKIMPVKVCASYWDVQFAGSAQGLAGFAPPDAGGCPTSALVQGIRYAADNGAKVINLSLGGPQASTFEQDALSYAVSKGAFVSVSAGNEFERNANRPSYPAAFAPALDGLMAVGAVGPSLTRAYYSNTGPYLEIAAPGGNAREGGRSAMVWQGTICLGDSDPANVVFPRFDRYCEVALQGTSMASPHVAGTAALIMSQGITKPAVVEALIKKTAHALGAPGAAGRNDEYGFGLIQPRAALFGFGLTK